MHVCVCQSGYILIHIHIQSIAYQSSHNLQLYSKCLNCVTFTCSQKRSWKAKTKYSLCSGGSQQFPHFPVNLDNDFFKDSPEKCKQSKNNTQHFLVCSQYKSNLPNITKKRQAKCLSSKLLQSKLLRIKKKFKKKPQSSKKNLLVWGLKYQAHFLRNPHRRQNTRWHSVGKLVCYLTHLLI